MSIGETINRNPAIGIVIAVAALGIAGFVIMRSAGGSSVQTIEQRYFYDLASGELIAMENVPGPVTTESGSQAVWAHVFSCGSCDDQSQRFVAYLQKLTDEAKQESAKPEKQRDSDVMMDGERIALPPEKPGGEITWIPAASPAAMQISESPLRHCSAGLPTMCQP